MLEPGHDLALVVGFLHGDVGHEAVGCGSMPMLLAGFDVDDVAGPDLDDFSAAVGDEPDAVGDVQRLALGVGMPGGASPGGEADVCAADRGLVVRVSDGVDVDVAGEPVGWSASGLPTACG